MLREFARELVVTDQPDYIRQVLGAQKIRAAAAQFHADQISERHGRHSLAVDRILWTGTPRLTNARSTRSKV